MRACAVGGACDACAGRRPARDSAQQHCLVSQCGANSARPANRCGATTEGESNVTLIDYPFQVDGRGRTALTTSDDHIRDLIEQVLFTAPGERVNRPTFGTGLPQLLFMPTNDEVATATQFLVQGALQ